MTLPAYKPLFIFPSLASFESMPLSQLLRVPQQCPLAEPLQRLALMKRTELTLVIGNHEVAYQMLNSSALYPPLANYLDDQSGPIWQMFMSKLEVHEPNGVLTTEYAHWLVTFLPGITSLQVVADLRSLNESEITTVIEQLRCLLHCWSPQLKTLRLWLRAELFYNWDTCQWISDLSPLWSAVNRCLVLETLAIDLAEMLPADAAGVRPLEEQLTILGQLQEFQFTSEQVSVWEQVLTIPSAATLALSGAWYPVNYLLGLPAHLAARFTTLGVYQATTSGHLACLLGYYANLQTLSIICDDPNFNMAQLIVALEAAGTAVHLATLHVRLGFKRALFSELEKGQLLGGRAAVRPLTSIKSLAIEKDWMADHEEVDLAPVAAIFPSLQTFKLVIKLSLCGAGCRGPVACAGTLLQPMQACASIRRLAVQLGPNSPELEFSPERYPQLPMDGKYPAAAVANCCQPAMVVCMDETCTKSSVLF